MFNQSPPLGNPLVSRLIVSKLFGELDYKLDFTRESPARDLNVSLLYGPNGTGKTTILRLLYSGLSPNSNEGLRGYIASVPFQQFSIELADGTTVAYQRSTPTAGDYFVEVSGTNQPFCRVEIRRDSEGRVNKISTPDLPKLIASLRALELQFIFVSHVRRIRTTYDFVRYIPAPRGRRQYPAEEREPPPMNAEGAQERFSLDVAQIAASVLDLVRKEFFEHNRFEEKNTNEIYIEIIRRLSSWNPPPDIDASTEFQSTIDELLRLQDFSRPVQQIGAMTPFPFDDFAMLLDSTSNARRPDVLRILQPFLVSLKSRIDALRPISILLKTVVDIINNFYSRKSISFTLSDGFQVTSRNGSVLPLHLLSSGEKHLLFLLCCAVLCRSDRCMFIVDEPELSLNAMWQRSLVDSLQQVAEDASVQFIFATHSLEILTEYRHRIVTMSE